MSKLLVYEEEKENQGVQRFYKKGEEPFGKELSIIDREILESKKAVLEESKILAKKSDMDYQAINFEKQIQNIEKQLNPSKNKTEYPKLSEDDLKLYKMYFPTSYSEGYETRYYDFDEIPINVLKLYAKLKESKEFDELLIFTPEKQESRGALSDPVLIGVKSTEFGNEHYLLAKWGKDKLVERSNIISSMLFKHVRWGAFWGCLLSIPVILAFMYGLPYIVFELVILLGMFFWNMEFEKSYLSWKKFGFLCEQLFKKGI